ncbi:hypothetical protein BJX61DRAFT_495479 [Aspergillus egyptiacus]|nr:hypothetical protein BJX61DRAFT_495479 [Aspergillus egyptiacus]
MSKPKSSLSQSRWAPDPNENAYAKSTPTPKPHSKERGNLLPPAQELARFMKIVARLRWKLPFLAEAYRLATLPVDVDPEFDIVHAEIMFKLDFHEYYALLERALVHLLGVFGITVSAASKAPHPGWASASHRYHANVLEALEADSSPLRTVLGSGNRIRQLRRAKELRNRWKTADLSQEEEAGEEQFMGRRETIRPLNSYDLEKIVAEIFDGLEEGYRLAEGYASEHDPARRAEVSDMDWDFIVDAMDWEAV